MFVRRGFEMVVGRNSVEAQYVRACSQVLAQRHHGGRGCELAATRAGGTRLKVSMLLRPVNAANGILEAGTRSTFGLWIDTTGQDRLNHKRRLHLERIMFGWKAVVSRVPARNRVTHSGICDTCFSRWAPFPTAR